MKVYNIIFLTWQCDYFLSPVLTNTSLLGIIGTKWEECICICALVCIYVRTWIFFFSLSMRLIKLEPRRTLVSQMCRCSPFKTHSEAARCNIASKVSLNPCHCVAIHLSFISSVSVCLSVCLWVCFYLGLTFFLSFLFFRFIVDSVYIDFLLKWLPIFFFLFFHSLCIVVSLDFFFLFSLSLSLSLSLSNITH